ncbi:hypothetical protein GCM10010528_18750 [Gordonia defluvii]|jgi:hypothetical protein|uniref:DUF2567 domain-containing protein n=1 Tax=Gordonia defluvii TaxID=283718 RepID=A0ABP6LB56_9ACTN|nr:DUF2567 domain-containing protein [Gordonia sp. UBA5067]
MSEPVMLAPGPDPGLPVGSGHGASAWRANVLVSAQLIRLVVGVALVSAIAAIVWAYTAPMPVGIVVRAGLAAVPSDQMSRYFDGIGWFSMGLLAIGVLAGSAFWWLARTWRGPIGVLALTATTVVSSGLAIEVAHAALRIRLPDPTTLPAGETFLHGPKLWLAAPVDGAVGAPGVLLVLMPTMALLVYLFHALFAGDPTLDADSV